MTVTKAVVHQKLSQTGTTLGVIKVIADYLRFSRVFEFFILQKINPKEFFYFPVWFHRQSIISY